MVTAVVCVLIGYALAQPDVETAAAGLGVRVAVWGQVRNPGLYRLAGSPDVLELVSAAGGPTENADLSRALLLRERDGVRLRLNIARASASSEPVFLVPGDVLIIPTSTWSRIKQELPVVSALAVFANVILTLTLIAQR
ncbi:MAG: SLBB domain-containing protein [candidate division WOR-3 bacterium]